MVLLKMNNVLFDALKYNSELIDRAINDHYKKYMDIDTESVRNAEQYSLNAGGKRIRAFLVNEF